MNVIPKALAYGTPGVAALVGGFLYVQHEVHYWLTPAHMATAGLGVGAVAVIACSYLGPKAAKAIGRKGKAQELPQADDNGEPDATAEQVQAYLHGMRDALLRRDALPEGAPHTVTFAGHTDHVTHRSA